MTDLITQQQTMNSYFFLKDIINPARLEAGENKVRNDDFLRRVEDEIDDLGGCEIFAAYGNDVKYYNLTIDQMMLVGMRESKAVRKNVLAKLKEMEKPQLPNFNDPVESARAWADAKEAEIKALAVIEEQAPKVRYFDKVSKNETHMNATQVGQKFKMSATILNRHLVEHGIYNKSIKRSKVFNQWFIDKEYGEMKQTEAGYSQAVFTTKGEQFIAELLTSEGII